MVVDLLERLRFEHGCTLVIVTHSRALAARAEQRFAIEGGRVVLTDHTLGPDRPGLTSHAGARP